MVKENTDKNVICDMLKSISNIYDISCEIGIIPTELNNATNCNSPNNLSKPSASETTVLQFGKLNSKIPKNKMDTYSLDTNMLHVALDYISGTDSSIGSNSTFYNLEETFLNYSRSPMLSPSLSTGTVNMEGNDQNDNIFCIEIFEEHTGEANEATKRDDTHDIKIIESSTTLEPSCNEECRVESCNYNREIKEEAALIHKLLPRFKYGKIYNALHRNKRAQNRVELTLWDLLPQKRPVAQLPSKQKFIGESCIIECKKMLNVEPDAMYVEDVDENDSNVEQMLRENINSKSDSGIVMEESSNVLKHRKLNVWNTNSSTDSKKFVSHQNLHFSEVLPQSSKNSKVSTISQKDIVRPAKFVVKDNMTHSLNHNVPSNNFKLVPPKFKYVPTLQQKNKSSRKTSNFRKKKKDTNSIKNKTICDDMNDVEQDTTKSTFCNNSSNSVYSRIKENYMQHSQFTKDTKRGTLSGISGSNNFNKQNVIPKIFAQPGTRTDFTVPLIQNTGHHSLTSIDKTSIHTDPSVIATDNSVLNIFNQNNKLGHKNNKQKYAKTIQNSEFKKQITPSMLNVYARLFSAESRNTATSETQENKDKNFDENEIVSSTSDYNDSLSHRVVDGTRPNSPPTSTVPHENNRGKMLGAIKKKEELPPEILEAYNHLMFMFPNVDKNYLKKTCLSYFKNEELLDPTERFELLTDHLLQNGESHLSTQDIQRTYKKQVHSMNEEYGYLSGIFPNADPSYLRDIVKDMKDNRNYITDFINTQLENPNYPTKEQVLAKIKITQQQKQYKTEFSVQQFLEIFPDPFAHFEDPNRQCKFNVDAFEFLKYHFSYFKVNTLIVEYNRHKHHLTRTANALENMVPDTEENRLTCLLPTEDIPLLQECAFIMHKTEIRQYLDELNAKEAEEFRQFKRRNELLECQCCYDTECMPSKCSTCDDGHVFCNSCIIRGTETRLAQGDTHVPCFMDCNGEFSLSVLQHVLPPTQFSILLRKRQEAEVMAAGVEGLVSCPFCHFASIPPPEDKVFKCLNPDCMKESCRECKEPNHIPFKCKETLDKTDKARLYLEEKMTEALVRKCYECDRPYFKEDGCNRIVCACGAAMCYICDKAIHGYQHFYDGTTTVARNKCPLWSNNYCINSQTVRKVAEKTAKHIKEKDPSIKVNVEELLTQPSDSRYNIFGVHSTAYALPERVDRLTRFDL